MGFNTAVLDMWLQLAPGSIQKLEPGPTFLPDKSGRARAYIVDLPGHMQIRSTPAHEGLATTCGDWLVHERWRINQAFEEPTFKLAIILLDCGTPANKSISRRPSSGKMPVNPKEGWRAHLAARTRSFDDSKTGPLDDNSVISDTELLLPGDPSAAEGTFTYSDFLKNKDFKALFYEIICKNLLENFAMPPDCTVVLRGPNTAVKLQEGVLGPADVNCKFRYKEADSVVGYFAALLYDFDVYVESADGDVLLALLMGCNTRLLPNAVFTTPAEVNKCFKNRVFVIRNQWAKYANTVVDINLLYYYFIMQSRAFTSLHKVMDPKSHRLVEKYAARNPILDQVVLAVLSGSNDYVFGSLMPQIGVNTLFVTYLRCFAAFPEGLTYRHVTETGYIGCYVDGTALWRFVVCCYKVLYPVLDIDINNLPYSAEKIREKLSDKFKEDAPTVSRIRMLVGHISWYMNYFANASYRQETHVDPMDRRGNRSAWGWRMENTVKDDCGYSKSYWDENINVEWIEELFEPRHRNINEKKAKLQPPRADPSKLISDQMLC
jgi:hypothetical protein